MSSSHTDGQHPLVHTDGMLRIKKKRAVRWCGGYCGYFLSTESPRDSKRQLCTVTRPVHRWKCRRNNQGIQNDSSVRWHVLFTIRIADGITDEIVRRWIRRQKLIHPLSLDPILPYFSFFFSFFFLISTLPNCKQPAPLPKKISLFSAQQVIYLEVFLSQHLCSDLPMDFYQFL